MNAAIEFRTVARAFGDVRAVDDVSFAIEPGEFFAMLGPSGSGKTTCLRLIAGFEQPDTGEIVLHGRPMQGVPPYDRPVNTVLTLRRFGGMPSAASPNSRTWPASGCSKPEISRRQVVLPEPDGPSMAKNSPSAISKLTASTARTAPKVRLTP